MVHLPVLIPARPHCLFPYQHVVFSIPAFAVRIHALIILPTANPPAPFQHVVFNMLAFVPMGCSLERLVGTVQVRGRWWCVRKCESAGCGLGPCSIYVVDACR